MPSVIRVTDITAKAVAYYESLRLSQRQRADKALRALIIEAYEQGYMAHNVH